MFKVRLMVLVMENSMKKSMENLMGTSLSKGCRDIEGLG